MFCVDAFGSAICRVLLALYALCQPEAGISHYIKAYIPAAFQMRRFLQHPDFIYYALSRNTVTCSAFQNAGPEFI
jgi:hypothetical protein